MRDFSKLSPKFWIGKTGREIRGDKSSQILAIYLITSPNANSIGLYYISKVQISHETGLTLEEVENALRRLDDLQFATYDDDSEFIWIIEMARWQYGGVNGLQESMKESDHRIPAINKLVRDMEGNIFIKRFCDKYETLLHIQRHTAAQQNIGKPLSSPLQAPSESLPSPLEGTMSLSLSLSPVSFSLSPSLDLSNQDDLYKKEGGEGETKFGAKELVVLWNERKPETLPRLQSRISPGRLKQIEKAIKLYPEKEFWEEIMDQYNNSRFLQGITGNPGGIKTFDWLIGGNGPNHIENYVNVHGGRYRDPPSQMLTQKGYAGLDSIQSLIKDYKNNISPIKQLFNVLMENKDVVSDGEIGYLKDTADSFGGL